MTEQYVTFGERVVLEEMELGIYCDVEMGMAYYTSCEECWEAGWTECIGHEQLLDWPVDEVQG